MAKFRAKARAIDLLGKGQIADLPTAITELWKNGYDAYADNIQCDLYIKGYKDLTNNLFTLSDNGIGMSQKDLEEKWIVVGTDSKVRRIGLDEEERFGKMKRPIMGEKGIGRLSVSYLGQQMMLITKKKNEKCACFFIDWRILENFNLYLDDIDIDIYTLNSINDFYDRYEEIIENFKNNLDNGDWNEHQKLKASIISDLDKIKLTEKFTLEDLENIYSEGHGTTFVIFNPHEQIIELKESMMNQLNKNFVVNDLRTSLLGFYNSFKEKAEFSTHFFIHDDNGKYDIIESTDFFTKEEMFSADHWLKGNFDKNGFFNGEVKIYNKVVKHTFRPTRAPGETPYGPFELSFGFLEGTKAKSILTEERWEYLYNKLNMYGGLYIYRDEIRVLPYGRQSSDFLRFEERRTLRAGTHFFSYRRMMGYIGTTREKNPKLIDKAGREGFITNNAYRAFVDDLIEFFIDLADRYYATKEENDMTMRQEQIDDIVKKNKKILENETKKSKKTMMNFKNELVNNEPRIEIIIEELNNLNNELSSIYNENEIIYNNVKVLSTELERKKIELKKLKIDKPSRGNLTSRQEKKYFEYNEKIKKASNIISENDSLLGVIQPRLSEENLQVEFKNRYLQYNGDIKNSLSAYTNRFLIASNYLESQFKNEKYKSQSLFTDKTQSLIEATNITNDRVELQGKIEIIKRVYEESKEEICEKFEPFIRHIEQFSFDVDEELLVGWYKEEYKKMKNKMDQLYELSQLGMTIEIIDHQFNVLYSEISDSLKFFGKISKNNVGIQNQYNQLKMAFQHLEYNHKLLTPLYRTSRRMKTEISGEDIGNYLEKFFGKVFLKESIVFEITKSFKEYKFYTFESIINPVFINIINNAIYWLTPVEKRNILIDYFDNKIVIMNSGVPIHHLDLGRIFELFVTKKPGGRGIGLYLAKVNLHTIEYDINATNDKKFNKLKGACFIIEKLGGETNE